ncbi:MAG: M16 family metallopeptidase [Planctomycetota bacterium]
MSNLCVCQRTVCFVVVLFFLSLPGFADNPMPTKVTTVEGITEYTLDNGLRILLFQDRSQPKVTVNCTIFVGSRHEGYGESGMAHLLEHMLFKGTELHPDIPKQLKDRGAEYNGTTWLDRTNYFETLPASDENLEFAIRLEADRLVNSKIRNEDLQSEFSVVRSEFERGENSPVRVLQQRMASVCYQWHNYGKSTIGNRSDIERVPIDSLRTFYRKYYRPDNAMLIVAGNFDEQKTLGWISEYFGAIAKPAVPLPPTYTVEPPQDGDRLTTVRRVGDMQYVGAMYHIPAGSDASFPAMELLSIIMTDEPSGRLYKSMVESKLGTGVGGGALALHDPGAISFMAQVPKGKSLSDAKEALIRTLEGLAESPITDEEVERARRQVLNQREMMAAKTQSLAIELSDWAAQGDWRLYFLHRDGIERTTAADVQQAALRYLVRNNRTVGLFEPITAAERIEIPERPDLGQLLTDYQGREATSQGEAFDPSPQNIQNRILKGKLSNGVPYALLPKKTRGSTVNVTINLRFGDETSLAGKMAAVELLGPLMVRGTKSMTLQQLNDQLDRLNANVAAFSQQQDLRVAIETKRETLLEVLDVVQKVLREPSLDTKEFDLLKEQAIAQLENLSQDPRTLAELAVARTLNTYERGDVRYVATIDEDLEDTRRLEVGAVKLIHQKFLSGSEGEIAVVGDFAPDEVVSKLTEMLGGWTSKIPYQRVPITPLSDVKAAMIAIETPDKDTAVYHASQQYALRDDHPNFAGLLMGNYILGASALSSRLGNRVRQKDGLSYSVNSAIRANAIDEFAELTITAIANPSNRDALVGAIDEEIRKIVNEGITEQELRDATQGYLQSQTLNRSRDGFLARVLANNLFAGRDMSYYQKLESQIEKLTVDDVNEAIKEFIAPDYLVIATAGDFAKPTPVKSGKGDSE